MYRSLRRHLSYIIAILQISNTRGSILCLWAIAFGICHCDLFSHTTTWRICFTINLIHVIVVSKKVSSHVLSAFQVGVPYPQLWIKLSLYDCSSIIILMIISWILLCLISFSNSICIILVRCNCTILRFIRVYWKCDTCMYEINLLAIICLWGSLKISSSFLTVHLPKIHLWSVSHCLKICKFLAV